MEKIKLLKTWAGVPSGRVIAVDALRAARLVKDGIGKPPNDALNGKENNDG